MACTATMAASRGLLLADAARDDGGGGHAQANGYAEEHREATISVKPTVVIASSPRCATQNTSTTPNSDSMHISSTIGMASSTMARSMLICGEVLMRAEHRLADRCPKPGLVRCGGATESAIAYFQFSGASAIMESAS